MKLRSLLALVTLCLLTLSIISCASRSGLINVDDSLAAIEIKNSTEVDIRQAVIETFLTDGYRRENIYDLTFEKKGNLVRQLEYASYMGGAATMRVKVRIESISANSHLVKINAFTVTNQNSSFGPNEKPVRGLRKGYYKGLLQDVKSRLPSY